MQLVVNGEDYEHKGAGTLTAQTGFAFRICLPEMPLVLSTRRRPAFRDGMASVGISRMSVASRTTVGGYGTTPDVAPSIPSHSRRGNETDENRPRGGCRAAFPRGRTSLQAQNRITSS